MSTTGWSAAAEAARGTPNAPRSTSAPVGVGSVPTDLDVFRSMLDRVRIPHREAPTQQSIHTPDGLDGCVSINIEANEQPSPGGYFGFGTEVVFGPDGALLAVWAWE